MTSRIPHRARTSPSLSSIPCTRTCAVCSITSIPTGTASPPSRSGSRTSRAIFVAARSSASSGKSRVKCTKPTAGASRSTAAPARTCSASLNFDMAALPIDPASPGQAGWVPGISSLPGYLELPNRSTRVRQPDVVLHQARQARRLRDGAHHLHGAMDGEQDRRHGARLLRHRQEPRDEDAHRLGQRVVSERQPELEYERPAARRAVLRLRRVR